MIKAVFAHRRRLEVRGGYARVVVRHFFHNDIGIRFPNRIRDAAGIAAFADDRGDSVVFRPVEPDGNWACRRRVETRFERSAVFHQYGMCVKIDLRVAKGECAVPDVYVAIEVSTLRNVSRHNAIDALGYLQIGIFITGRECMCGIVAPFYLLGPAARGSSHGHRKEKQRNGKHSAETVARSPAILCKRKMMMKSNDAKQYRD